MDESRQAPAMGFGGMFLLLLTLGILLRKKRLVSSALLGFSLISLGISVALHANPLFTTQTTSDGHFEFEGVAMGTYEITADKDCYVPFETVVVAPSDNDDVTVPDLNMDDLSSYNESLLPAYLQEIFQAETKYNEISSPHTFTGNLACLVSGNGACGFSFLDPDFGDGVVDGYNYSLVCGAPDGYGSIWDWSVTAFPVSYDCTGRTSFYEGKLPCPGDIVKGEDIGGGPGDETMGFLCPGNKMNNVYEAMKAIWQANIDYKDNSSPHTYTGSLACLTSGNGAGGVPLLCETFADCEECGYRFQMDVSEPDSHQSRWAWSCTAFPVHYSGETTLTFYVDETSVVRCGDTGGVPGDVSLASCCDFMDKVRNGYDQMSNIIDAEKSYNTNSSPHTYTGSLACLASGNGAGGRPFIIPELDDGLYCGYHYNLTCSTPDNYGSSWFWSCAAVPVMYSSETPVSFYCDESGVVRGGDLGGAPAGPATNRYTEYVDDKHDYAIVTLQDISEAETQYNNQSSPHTYTGSLACLASGNGAGGKSLISFDLADGMDPFYNYALGVSDPVPEGNRWYWSCTAWPISYSCDSCLSFYIDETGVLRAMNAAGAPIDETAPSQAK